MTNSLLLSACSNLEPIFRRQAERQHIPGVAYGVIADGELIFTHSFGVRDVDTQAAVDADSVFCIASMTKSFTAAAILHLRDAGQLRLDESAATYVPELAGLRHPTADAPLLTVRHLLTMSAGLPEDNPWGDRQVSLSNAALSQLFREGAVFANAPGIVFEYSNFGYFVLGRIVANVSGVPMMDYLTRALLQPLGMTATTWQHSAVTADRLARGYRWEDGQWKAERVLPSGGDVAAFAGLCSSVRDLARWVVLFQSSMPPRDDPDTGLVRRSSLREMQQVWCMYPPTITVQELGQPPKFSAGGYGYGLSMTHNGRYARVGHGGGFPGFGSYMAWLPAYGIGIVALGNITYANVHVACSEALDELLLTSQARPRAVQPNRALEEAREQVTRWLDGWDDALADTLFADNFWLDSDRAHWQQRIAELRRVHGAWRPEGAFEVENSLRGRWRLVGERGWCWVFITLSPTVPPRVQYVQLDSTLPPSPLMQTAAERLAALVSHPTQRAWARWVARDAPRDVLWERVRVAHVLCGTTTVGEVLAGDGDGWAKWRFVGERGSADVELTLDTRTGKVREMVWRGVGGR